MDGWRQYGIRRWLTSSRIQPPGQHRRRRDHGLGRYRPVLPSFPELHYRRGLRYCLRSE